MPPEWAPHEATWLSWPHNRNTWPDGLEAAEAALVEGAAALARHGVYPVQPRLEHFKCYAERKPIAPFPPRTVALQRGLADPQLGNEAGMAGVDRATARPNGWSLR